MSATFQEKFLDRARWRDLADWLAIALVVSLPWSTSATGILAVLWLLAAIPGLDLAQLRRDVMSAAGGLPVLLWVLGLVGMLWADVSWPERLAGLNSFHKLLFIPLLFVHFRGSERGPLLLRAFVASCSVLLALSWTLIAVPGLAWQSGAVPGVPVKNYASQSDLFTVCAFVLADASLRAWREARRQHALGLAVLAIVFVANIGLVVTTRTALVELPVLALIFGFVRFGWRGIAVMIVALAVLGAAAWSSSQFLRTRILTFNTEVQAYANENTRNSAGERLEFWKKSMSFVKSAPLTGHGTGSIRQQFERAAAGGSGASAVISTNPHNQTFAVAIQLGLVGAAVLFAMWIAHFVLFRAADAAAWVGLVIVVQNVIGSLFNSQLFDFTQGWGYVLGVGIAGGIVLKNRR